jgi:hypothetical protein
VSQPLWTKRALIPWSRLILRIHGLGKIKVNAKSGRVVVGLIINLDHLREILCYTRSLFWEMTNLQGAEPRI